MDTSTDIAVPAAPENQDELWSNRIERRERFLKHKIDESHWERYIKEYHGDFTEVLAGTNKVIPLNLIYAYVRTEMPSLYLQDPYFEFTPKKDTKIESAKLKEMAVNDLWSRKKWKREVKKGIQDGKLIGHAWYKVGFNANIGNLEEAEDNREFTNDNDYFFYRLNWRHILFNDESIDPPYDSTWIAQKFFVPLEVAKRNKDWKNVDKINGVNLTGNDTKTDALNRNLPNETVGDTMFAELYEIWDKVNNKVIIFCKQKGVGTVHVREWPYVKMQGYPFLMLNLSFQNDDPYGISDVGMGELHVLEKTKIRTAFLEHLKRGNRQLLTKKNNFDAAAKDAYRNGEDSALVEVDDPGAVAPLPYAQFQSDVFALESRLDDDLAQIWGQRPNDRSGQARTQTRTKFELQAQGMATSNRLAEQQNIIQDLVVEAAEKISSLLEQYATEPYYVRLTGYDPKKVAEMLAGRPSATGPGAVTNQSGFTVTSDDIKGPTDVTIQEGSAIPLDKAGKIGLLKEIAGFYVELAQVQKGPFIGKVAQMLVEEAGMHELTDALEQEVQFIQQQQQQAQAQQDQLQQVQIGHKSTELQLKAQDIAVKQDKVNKDSQAALLKIVSSLQIAVGELKAQQQQMMAELANAENNAGNTNSGE